MNVTSLKFSYRHDPHTCKNGSSKDGMVTNGSMDRQPDMIDFITFLINAISNNLSFLVLVRPQSPSKATEAGNLHGRMKCQIVFAVSDGKVAL